MNVLESTDFFVRVTVYDFLNTDKEVNLRFRIVPVIHIGSEQFYEGVFENLNECDEVIYEGVEFKGTKGITNLHRWTAKKLNLVTQNSSLNMKAMRHKLIHADYTEEFGKKEWKKLRFREKLKLKFLLPLQIRIQMRDITRRKLGKQFMTSAEEQYLAYGPREDEEGTVNNFIMNRREQILFEILRKKMANDLKEDKLIGIIYGAGHMKSISRYLIDQLGYFPNDARFLEVFKII